MRNTNNKCDIDNKIYDKECERIGNEKMMKMRNILEKCEMRPKCLANKCKYCVELFQVNIV